jgi:biopolymer transport protein ExbD
MVDLAFLLITFFMLTTSMNKPGMFGLTMPDKTDPTKETGVPASRTLTLCIGSNHKVVAFRGTIEEPFDKPVVVGFDKDGLRKTISDTKNTVAKESGKSTIVLLKSSDKSQYGDLVNALDELKITGIDTYAVIDITKKDIELLKQKNLN